MKKLFWIVLTIGTLMLAGCLTGCEKSSGNDLLNLKLPENSFDTLSMYCYNGEKTFWGYLFDDDAEREILESLSAVSAKMAEDWSPADIAFPVYGIKYNGVEAAWSNGYWITQTGEAYRFEYDFAAVWEDYDWDGKDNTWSTAAIMPCSYYFCRDENGWIKDYLPPTGNLPEMPDTLAVSSKLDGDKLTVSFTNNGEKKWYFGEYFEVQAQLDGKWYNIPKLPGDWVYPAIALLVMPQQILEHEYDLICCGELPEGKYRLVTESFWTEFYIGNAAETVSKSRDEKGEWIAENLQPADLPNGTQDVQLFITAQDENSVTVRLFKGHSLNTEAVKFGNAFRVEVFLNGKWYIVPTKDIDFAFPLTLGVLHEGESMELTYDFYMYDPFPAGRYRVVNGGEFWFEFTAGEKITPQNDLTKDAVRNFHVIYYEDGREIKAYIGSSKEVGEFLNIVSANPAEKVTDWSAEKVTSPIFGIEATDAQGWTVEGVWSNGYWISNRHNDVYRLDLDMDMLKKKIVLHEGGKSESEDVPIAWLPCGKYLCRDKNGGWIAERLSVPAWELPEPPENVTAEIVANTGSSVTVQYTNNGEKDWLYGEGYSLEVQLDGEWYDVPRLPGEYSFTDIGYDLPAGESCFKDYDFFMYDTASSRLPSGRYRIIANDFVLEFDLDTENTLFHRDA